MSGRTQTSPASLGQGPLTVRRLVPAPGLTSARIVRAVRQTLSGHPIRNISIALVDDATMAAIRERYTGLAGPTDVLAFDLRDEAARGAKHHGPPIEVQTPIEGEIVVSVDTARRQAACFGADLPTEVLRYVIHGILHLRGLDDHTRAGRARMRRAEDGVIATLAGRPLPHRPPRRERSAARHARRRTASRA